MGSHADAERGPLGTYSDAARRISDAVTLHLTVDPAGNSMKWIAFRLSDGECRPEVFGRKADAMRAVGMFASLYGFAQLLPSGMTPRQAASYLKTCRQVADDPRLRWRQTDADAPADQVEQILTPLRIERAR